jgi:hypothetical protein
MQRSLRIATGTVRAREDVGWPAKITAFARSAFVRNLGCGKLCQSDFVCQVDKDFFIHY